MTGPGRETGTENELAITYRFSFADGGTLMYEVRLDPVAFEGHASQTCAVPDWALLAHHRCENCTLEARPGRTCPAAMSTLDLMGRLSGVSSHETVCVQVQTPERLVETRTSAQRGFSSLLGLLLATSGCPRTAHFRPMARFHLPLADEDETIYRATSMYLLGQYFRHQEGRDTDWDLTGLVDIYRNLQIVNLGLTRRMREACEQDAAINAVVLLDLFAKALPMTIADNLEDLRPLFAAYLEKR